jgi:hypothetical protein
MPIQWRAGGGGGEVGVSNPHPKFRSFDKAVPNSQFRSKYIRNNLIIRVSLICKLSRTPDYGAAVPRSPFSLPSALKWICFTPQQNSWECHCADTTQCSFLTYGQHCHWYCLLLCKPAGTCKTLPWSCTSFLLLVCVKPYIFKIAASQLY